MRVLENLRGELTANFHSPIVTSNLAIDSQLAHHGQGGGSIASQGNNGHKSFVL
jgi:hypothetical protein